MSVFDSTYYDEHEMVQFVHDADSGLNAIIAVHNTVLGPACGGCRLWSYNSSTEALDDALRLSRGMSYKNALAGLPIGGGKAVIIARQEDKSPAMMQAFGRFVDRLNGQYITAEDVGIDVEDMLETARNTTYVGGLPRDNDIGGDPSPYTAQGVYNAMRAAWRHYSGSEELRGVHVLIQGTGHVGYHLCRLLVDSGARVSACDQNKARIEEAAKDLNITVVSPDSIFDTDMDIFSPCALGAILNAQTIPKLKARVVAGAANNQLGVEGDGDLLMKHGILYAPDYVINSGGIISVWSEFANWSAQEVKKKIDHIYHTTLEILGRSSQSGTPPNRVADQMAKELIYKGASSTEQ